MSFSPRSVKGAPSPEEIPFIVGELTGDVHALMRDSIERRQEIATLESKVSVLEIARWKVMGAAALVSIIITLIGVWTSVLS